MIYMFLADGFEEIEALCPLDLFRRAELDVTTVGVSKSQITGAHGITVTADMTDADFISADLEMIFLPGGMPGTLHLADSEVVMNALRYASDNDKYIAAICAAPSILGDEGLLHGKSAVCYPGFEDRLIGATIPAKKVVVDGKLITAKGMGAALEMGLEIVAIFRGKEYADELRHTVIAD